MSRLIVVYAVLIALSSYLPVCGATGDAPGSCGFLDNVVHRGWGLEWPHNALVSIRKCWKEGLVPEVDARLCKERKIDVVPKKPAKYYITQLEEYDKAQNDWEDEEEDDYDDDQDWEDEE